jgi:hypothetical protein
MTLGIVGRADSTGLGTIGWEFVRHLRPGKVLGIDLSGERSYAPVRSRFPASTHWTSGFPTRDEVGDFLDGCSTVLTFETPYGPDLFPMAREKGIRTVLVVMPEYLPTYGPGQGPDLFVNPTPWSPFKLPSPTMTIPIPIALDRFDYPRIRPLDEPLRLVHPAGRIVGRDRNGTLLVEKAAKLFHVPVELAVQEGRPIVRDLTNYFDVFVKADVLVLPRRYGGLCLPMQEAAAMGIPTVLLDVGGYREMEWPGTLLVPSSRIGARRMRGNQIVHYQTRPPLLARYVNALLDDEEHYEKTSVFVRSWAEARSWEALRGWWESVL